MTITVTKLFPAAALTTSAETLYTMPTLPASSTLKNGRVALTNTTAGAVTATLYSNTAATAAYCFLSARSIAAGDTIYVDVPTLGVGDAIVAKAGFAASITVHECGGALYS